MTNPVGRPLKFQTVEDLQAAIDAFFDSIAEPRVIGETIYQEPATITGLALALGLSRQALCNYEVREEFVDTVKTAKLRCENYAERQLFIGKSATGPIFALKNFGWSDAQDINLGGQHGKNPIKTDVTITPEEAYRRMLDGSS
jgi:hypothetical protein